MTDRVGLEEEFVVRPLGPEHAAELMAEMTRRENAQIEKEDAEHGDK